MSTTASCVPSRLSAGARSSWLLLNGNINVLLGSCCSTHVEIKEMCVLSSYVCGCYSEMDILAPYGHRCTRQLVAT